MRTVEREQNIVLNAVPGGERRKPVLVAEWVRDERGLREAQRLRHDVFAEEYGVCFDDADGLDRDRFDGYCDHLLVRDVANGLIAAYTRVLSSEGARLAGGFYSEAEFDMSALSELPGRVLEVGRTCVHPDYRSGAAITVLWSALAEYLLAGGFSHLLGCASIGLRDGGHNFSAIMPKLRAEHLVEPDLRVSPRRRLALTEREGESALLPPLLKAYLRMGARIGGEACWDPEFNCADVFILLDVAALSERWASRFLARAANA